MIALIVAYAEGRVIGNGNDIPWHIPADFKHFKSTTLGHPIVMGRKTWDSLPKKPLPNRTNIVISRSEMDLEGVDTFTDIEAALEYASRASDIVYVIGGQGIYEQTIDKADRLVVSHVKGEFVGDKYFPEFELEEWEATTLAEHEEFTVVEYNRKRG